jgi:hypothetical protein
MNLILSNFLQFLNAPCNRFSFDWTSQEKIGKEKIPFYRLTTLDSSTPVRGLNRWRFRDKNTVVFNLEYRFPIWKYTTAAIFYDTGQVFSSPLNMSINHFVNAGGGAIYLNALNFLLFNFTAAYSSEGFNILFGMTKPI